MPRQDVSGTRSVARDVPSAASSTAWSSGSSCPPPGRVMAWLPYGVSPADPATLAATQCVIAVAAGAVPGCRARDSAPTRLTPNPVPRLRSGLHGIWLPRIDFGCSLDGWPSGLRRTPGKRVGPKGSREFESHSVRQLTDCCAPAWQSYSLSGRLTGPLLGA
jgi:hypothetical protein